jgi:hypothetical protein
MPYGALSPLDYPSDVITIRCDHCDRTGRYRRALVIERFGANVGMPEVLSWVTDCDRNKRVSSEGCRAVYVELRERYEATRNVE